MKKIADLISNSAFIYLPALFALVVPLWYQLRVFDTHIVFIFDSAHYFLASSQMLGVLQACLTGHLATALAFITEPAFVANIMLDGPVMPMMGALAFIVTGQPALATSWPVIVCLLSTLSACGAASVAFIAHSLTGSKRIAFLTAFLFAAYPTTIASAGRFLTEPVATFFLLGLAVSGFMIVSSRSSSTLVLFSLMAGLYSAVGFLLKPALLPAWAALLALAFFHRLRGKSSILMPVLVAAATVALAIGSWLAYTKVATGKFYLMPQRQPASNVAQGHELETDGRGAMGFDSPTDKVSGNADSRSIFVNAWREHPGQISNLYLRKMTRTLGFAWNDFKQKVFGLNIEQQDFLHAIFLTLGLIGLPLMLLEQSSRSAAAADNSVDTGRSYFLLVTPLMVLIHAFLYLPFESTVRYGAPALPFLLLSAGYSLSWLGAHAMRRLVPTLVLILLVVLALKAGVNLPVLQQLPLGQALLALTVVRIVVLLLVYADLALLIEKDSLFRALSIDRRNCARILCAFAYALFIILPICATSLYRDNQRECPIELTSGQKIERTVAIPLEQKQPASSQYLIYVDCDKRFASARFFFNDVPIEGRLIEANKVDSSSYFVFNIMRMYASIFDMPVSNMRQWRVLEIPASLIQFGSSNSLSVVAGSNGLTVFADRFDVGEGAIRLPNKALFSASKMCNEGLELDGRVLERHSTQLWSTDSLVALDREKKPLKYRQPRLYLLRLVSASPSVLRAGAAFSARTPLALDRFDPVLLTSGRGRALKIDRYTMQLAKSTSLATAMPRQFGSTRQVQISLRGKVRSIGRSNKIGIFVTLHGTEPNSPFMILPGSPPFIESKSEYAEFEIKDRIFLSSAPNQNYMVSVGLFPGRWEQFSQYGIDRNVGSFLVKDLMLSVSKTNDIDLSSGVTTIY
jgi:hypothetical protein